MQIVDESSYTSPLTVGCVDNDDVLTLEFEKRKKNGLTESRKRK